MGLSGRRATLWPALWSLLLVSCSAPDDPVRRVEAQVVATPKIVIQIGHQAPVVAVLWANRGRSLFSLADDGSIIVWSPLTGDILDRAQLPFSDQTDKDVRQLASFATDADERVAVIAYRTNTQCPQPARAADGTCRFTLNLATRAITAGGTAPASASADLFPLSSDGRYRPIPNHDDGKAGLFDPSDEYINFDESGCVSRERCRYGVNLNPVSGGGSVIKLTGSPRSYFLDVDISPDGRQMIRLESLASATKARVQWLDLTNGLAQPKVETRMAYHRLMWLDANQYAVFSRGYQATDDLNTGFGFPPAMIVDRECANLNLDRPCRTVPAHALMQPLDNKGGFIGAGSLANFCYFGDYSGGSDGVFCNDGGQTGRPERMNLNLFQPQFSTSGAKAGRTNGRAKNKTMAKRDSSGPTWQLQDAPALAGQSITAIKVARDGGGFVVATRAERPGTVDVAVYLFDPAAPQAPRALASFREDLGADHVPSEYGQWAGTSIDYLAFNSGGTEILFGYRGKLHVVPLDGAAERSFPLASAQVVAGTGKAFGIEAQTLVDTATGKSLRLDNGNERAVRAGFIDANNIFWTASDDGRIHFWNSQTGAKQLTLYSFPDNRFFAVRPDGRYDTNLGPDTNQVRWLASDAPWQSFASQTFMRDYYEPQLYAKMLECNAAGTCATAFRGLPSIASLNRLVPIVRITAVKPGTDPATATVELEVQPVTDPDAANGKVRSGAYGIRLFRNGRVVAIVPDQPDAATDTVEKWRKLNDISDPKDPEAMRRYTFTVNLPTGKGTEQQLFSAYAFNEDRIKSETASFAFKRPPVALRSPRAFVLTIGIDAYDTERFRLNYAVADARLIADRLYDIPGYEMRRVTLAGEIRPDGTKARVDNSTLWSALGLLMSDLDRDNSLKRIRDEAGVDASALEKATPDDIVIVSFSGHGWADKDGNFYLITTNGYWDDAAERPELRSVFATAELNKYFRAIDAGDITLIIDACHSSASVASANFKPGPMGDSGLGQLAYDKGIRILAATQANDVALEDPSLGQGLLTYALAGEGLTAQGGMADLDRDRRIRLDEWLGYAVERLPSLSQDPRVGQLRVGLLGSGQRAIVFHDLPRDAPKRRVQKPSLFDFNAAPSSLILRNNVR